MNLLTQVLLVTGGVVLYSVFGALTYFIYTEHSDGRFDSVDCGMFALLWPASMIYYIFVLGTLSLLNKLKARKCHCEGLRMNRAIELAHQKKLQDDLLKQEGFDVDLISHQNIEL